VEPAEIVLFSSTTRLGRDELLERLREWVTEPQQ
jgi:hypothetical protein